MTATMDHIFQVSMLVVVFSSLASAQYCSVRGCCVGRDDDCHTPFYDTLCYCDHFCYRTGGSDCCPDYNGNCRLDFSTPTPTPSSGDVCFHDGNSYEEGATVRINCNQCTCRINQFLGGLDWNCGSDLCAVEEDLIDRINVQDYGWKAGNYSSLWGMSYGDGLKYRTGTFKPQKVVNEQTEVNIELPSKLPINFDARDKWPEFIGGVEDQGDCGSSWALSTIALTSDRLAIQSEGLMRDRLSAQHVLSCNARGQLGCEGGYTDRAFWFLRKEGAVTEECYPYESGLSSATSMDKLTCRIRRGRSGPCPTGVVSKRQKATPPYRIGMSEDEIKYEMFINGPVQATFLVKEDFFVYRSGVYRHTHAADALDKSFGDGRYHSVRLIGWGVDNTDPSNPIPYWMAANSWGDRWGEDGYFRILRGSNECDIESFIVGVWGQVSSNI